MAYYDTINTAILNGLTSVGAESYADQHPSVINAVKDSLLEREYEIAEQLVGYASSDLGYSESEAKGIVGRAGLSVRPEPVPEPEPAPAAEEGSTEERILGKLNDILERLGKVEDAARRQGIAL